MDASYDTCLIIVQCHEVSAVITIIILGYCEFHVAYLDYADLTRYVLYQLPHDVNPSSDSYYSNNNGCLSAWVNCN